MFWLGFALGLWAFSIYVLGALGELMHFLELFLFGLWLTCCALVFVCLIQSLSYMLWMKKCSMTFSCKSESGKINVLKDCLIEYSYFVYVVEALIT